MLNKLRNCLLPTRKKALWALFSALLFSTMGIVLSVISVHGPAYSGYAGWILLFPVFLLAKVGLQIPIPIFYSTSTLGLALFLLIQYIYYYVLLSLLFVGPQKPQA